MFKTYVIDGKQIANDIKQEVKHVVENSFSNENKPTLACILVGDNPASMSYVKSKEKACEMCGINSQIYRLNGDCSLEELESLIKNLNNNEKVSAILLQLPLPEHLEEYRDYLINLINPVKDVDALTDVNLGKLLAGKELIAPCTATGIMKIIESTGYNVVGKDVVVIGRSLLVGKSVAALLQNANATVTICHSKSVDLKEKCSKADLLIVAIGKPKFINKDYVKNGAFVVDVGINRTEQGLVGDVDYDDVKDLCNYITPVPGGVGPLTVACLMQNTLTLHELQLNLNKSFLND